MPLALPPGATSLCWSCKYWDWRIAFSGVSAMRDWINECNHPCEYEATDDKTSCEGYEKESK